MLTPRTKRLGAVYLAQKELIKVIKNIPQQSLIDGVD